MKWKELTLNGAFHEIFVELFWISRRAFAAKQFIITTGDNLTL